MTISTADWKRYIAQLRRVSNKAAEEMQRYVQLHGFGDTDALIEYAWALATKYGEAAAAAACDMFDAVAEASGTAIPGALPAETATFEETAKAVNGTLKQGAALVPDTVGRLVKQAGADTTLQNAERYGAEFAWVPMGDTCAFCRMLASNGWQRQSKKAMKGGHAEHIHANCDCQYALRFDGKGGVAGYDPDKYRAEYDAAEGDTWQEKLNSMRREQYKQDGEKIRAQKRAAYREKVLALRSRIDENANAAIIEGSYDPADIRRAMTQASNNFVIRDPNHPDSLYGEICDNIPPLKGFYDIKAHGAPNAVKIFNSPVDAHELARIIMLRSDYDDRPIRLLSCETGKLIDGTCIAKELSTLLGVDVMAPTEVLKASGTGKTIVISDEGEKGWMRLFHPDGSYEENI
ncbi:MAG: hypothetical protein IJ713_01295 [Oscillibacter sp.]|nr:hypothetical protein [Oscillibacter sp.]